MSEPKDEIYSADSYPPNVLPKLLRALNMMRGAHELLEGLSNAGSIDEGTPADLALATLQDSINMLEPDEARPIDGPPVQSSLKLVVNNTHAGRAKP